MTNIKEELMGNRPPSEERTKNKEVIVGIDKAIDNLQIINTIINAIHNTDFKAITETIQLLEETKVELCKR